MVGKVVFLPNIFLAGYADESRHVPLNNLVSIRGSQLIRNMFSLYVNMSGDVSVDLKSLTGMTQQLSLASFWLHFKCILLALLY